MKTLHAEPLFQSQCILGEGPLWHPVEKCLYWVDIQARKLYISNQDLTDFECFEFETSIGCFGFRKTGGLILGTSEGFAYWDRSRKELETVW
ncbi:MAG: SMP-30/gluconolactonase/LRE family protein, partial [Brevefilum sp.]